MQPTNDDFTRCVSRAPASTGFYLRHADGRRTKVYTSWEACWRAVARGELYTDAAYAALTAPTPVAAQQWHTMTRRVRGYDFAPTASGGRSASGSPAAGREAA